MMVYHHKPYHLLQQCLYIISIQITDVQSFKCHSFKVYSGVGIKNCSKVKRQNRENNTKTKLKILITPHHANYQSKSEA